MRLNLGYRDLPDAMLPNIQAVFGGATAAETQANIQAWVWGQLRRFYLARHQELLEPEFQIERDRRKSSDVADWPEE